MQLYHVQRRGMPAALCQVTTAQLQAQNMGYYNWTLVADTVALAPGPVSDPWSRFFLEGLDKAFVPATFGLVAGPNNCLSNGMIKVLIRSVWRVALGLEDFLELDLSQNASTAACMQVACHPHSGHVDCIC